MSYEILKLRQTVKKPALRLNAEDIDAEMKRDMVVEDWTIMSRDIKEAMEDSKRFIRTLDPASLHPATQLHLWLCHGDGSVCRPDFCQALPDPARLGRFRNYVMLRANQDAIGVFTKGALERAAAHLPRFVDYL